MERTNVTSSHIKSIGFDEETKTLEIEFLDGRIYQYSGVSEEVYEGLMSASSHGTFLHANIKRFPGRYPYKRIR